jgi:hypothetical protein
MIARTDDGAHKPARVRNGERVVLRPIERPNE